MVVDLEKHLSYAVKGVVRPLVRLLMNWGIGYKDFSAVVKRAYLEEAEVSLDKREKKVTASSLAVISGIHRKETSAFLRSREDEGGETALEPPELSAAFTVFSEWIAHPDYLDADNTPLTLPYAAEEEGVSFVALCEMATKDVRPKTLLDELLRLDLLEEQGRRVALKKHAHTVSDDLEAKLHFFAHNVGEHMDAAVSNVIGGAPLRFERMVTQAHLTSDDVRMLATDIETEGMEFLKEIYRRAEVLAQKNVDSSETLHSLSVGLFSNDHKERVL